MGWNEWLNFNTNRFVEFLREILQETESFRNSTKNPYRPNYISMIFHILRVCPRWENQTYNNTNFRSKISKTYNNTNFRSNSKIWKRSESGPNLHPWYYYWRFFFPSGFIFALWVHFFPSGFIFSMWAHFPIWPPLPCGCSPIWAVSQVGGVPCGCSPKWALSHLGPIFPTGTHSFQYMCIITQWWPG